MVVKGFFTIFCNKIGDSTVIFGHLQNKARVIGEIVGGFHRCKTVEVAVQTTGHIGRAIASFQHSARESKVDQVGQQVAGILVLGCHRTTNEDNAAGFCGALQELQQLVLCHGVSAIYNDHFAFFKVFILQIFVQIAD